MKQTEIDIPAKYLSGLHINGMHGRVLSIPAKKKASSGKTVLLVYGHHSSIERMYSVASYLANYANIVMPDLPGFGGMDSFYVINKQPSLDNMADYLATFIKMKFKQRPIAICGMSYGFLVVTKMLQKYPDLQNQVQLLVSLVGFTHQDDFKFSTKNYRLLLYGSKFFSYRPTALFAKYVLFTRPIITFTYTLQAHKNVKMTDASKSERTRRIQFEVYLWQCNDARTYFATSHSFLRANVTNNKIGLPVHHVGVRRDQYFDKRAVRRHLKIIFTGVTVYTAALPNHAPTVVSNEAEAANLIPKELQRILRQKTFSKV